MSQGAMEREGEGMKSHRHHNSLTARGGLAAPSPVKVEARGGLVAPRGGGMIVDEGRGGAFIKGLLVG